MVDELIYSELAKSVAAGEGFRIRGDAVAGAYGFVYPLLLAPAWALFDCDPGRVHGREGDQRPRGVARGRARLPARAPFRLADRRLRRRRAHGRAAVAPVRGDADDGERVLPAVPARRARARVRARAADVDALAAPARRDRARLRHPRPGRRLRPGRAARAARARGRGAPLAHSPGREALVARSVVAALRRDGRRSGARARRAARARTLAARPPRRVPLGRGAVVRRRRGAALALLARGGARPLARDPSLRRVPAAARARAEPRPARARVPRRHRRADRR